MKNRPPVKFYNPLWPASQNVDSCYRATGSFISSFIRPLRNGFMTFLRSTGTQTKSRQEFLFACLGFCFLRPAGLQQQPWEGVWVRKPCWQAGGGAEAQQMKSHPSIYAAGFLFISSCHGGKGRGGGGGVVVVWVSVFVFYGLYSNSPRVKLFLEPPSVIISSPYQYSPPTGVISVLIQLKEYYAVPGPRLNWLWWQGLDKKQTRGVTHQQRRNRVSRALLPSFGRGRRTACKGPEEERQSKEGERWEARARAHLWEHWRPAKN